MRSWTPLWSMIVKSSLWREPDWVMKVFITMLALADQDDIYRGTAFNLADDSKKSEQEVLEALKVLSSPDTLRIEKQPFEGRRIQAVNDGWLILNRRKYRELLQLEMKRARDARAQATARAKKKLKALRGFTAPPTAACSVCDQISCVCQSAEVMP